MLHARLAIIVAVSLISASTAFSKSSQKTSPEELAQITERGRALYAYDQAAWHATDAVVATHPNRGKTAARSPGRPTPGGLSRSGT